MLNKKIMLGVVTSLSLFTTASFAVEPGTYFGAQAGYGDVHQSLSGTTSKKENNLAGRLLAGYQFNTNWAAELGWTKFGTVSGKVYGNTINVKTDAVDLTAKGIYPVGNNINLYGKLGAAYLMQRGEAHGPWISGHIREKENGILPTAGVGVSYDFTPNLAGDISYNRIQKVGSTRLNSTDYVGVGLIYSIG